MAAATQPMTTKWWHRRDDQLICTLCPRECALHAGQRGFCFVRQNIQDEMVLTTYGRSSGFCIDPIEKKPLNHFLPGTPVLSFGTAGCNLGCKFCQNWEISKAKEFDDRTDFASPEGIAAAAVQHGCRSVAFTYNDPVIWAEYAIDTARACHAVGIKTVAVTAGYISSEARGEFYSVMDAANVDLKGFTPEFYQFLTLSKIDPVLETLRWLKHESNVWFEITNLMIPGENDSPEETARMCDWIVENLGPDVPVHFTAFHPDFRMPDHPPTPPATLQRARQQALQAGIRYAYVGNVHDVAGQSTRCPGCQSLLIERDWYQLGQYRLNGNRCGKCGAAIAGVFEERPGAWGPQRKPIRISDMRPVPLSLPASATTTSPPLTQLITNMPSSPINPLDALFAAGHNSPAPFTSEPAASDPAAEPTSVSATSPTPAATPQVPQARVDFTSAEADLIASYARAVAHAALHQEAVPELSGPLADIPVYGMFVTFRLGDKLRACKGQFGQLNRLGEVLNRVTQDSATNDPRFTPLRAGELPQLEVEVSLMFNPQPVTAAGAARLDAIQVGTHGLVIAHPRGRGLLLPQVATEHQWDALAFLQGVCRKAGLPNDAWMSPETQLMTFQARLFHSRPEVAPGSVIREAVKAGQFYPNDPEVMRQQIARYMPPPADGGTVESYRAVMLPHAGWLYCGDVMGRTLSRTRVPRTVIIVSPKHTPFGPAWSVSNADRWQIPGHEIPVATEVRERLLELVPALECESAGHIQEHGIEVILPFLHARNPELRIVPIVLGATSYSQTEQFAQALAIICQESREPVLLVISSDLNHFAPESENRRLDFLALDALCTGDAGFLFDVTQEHQISMCGVIPAITVLRALGYSGESPRPELVHYDNSGTASGKLDRVVGYAGVVIK